MPSSSTILRIQREYDELMKISSNHWSLRPKTNTLMIWEGNIHALDDPRHAGKSYSLEIRFAENHPFHPPKIHFLQRVECENVFNNGEVCMDILGDEWSPALSLDKLMFALCSLLTDPPVTGYPYKGYNTIERRIRTRRNEVELLST
jgi:ubiquitin-conjugating enzyme E2 D